MDAQSKKEVRSRRPLLIFLAAFGAFVIGTVLLGSYLMGWLDNPPVVPNP